MTADLTQLAEDLEPLVDLGDLEMAGRLQASIDFARTGSTQIDINGQGIVEDFHLSLPEGQRFEDQRMTIRLQAQAALSKNKLVAVHQANFPHRLHGGPCGCTVDRPGNACRNCLPACHLKFEQVAN